MLSAFTASALDDKDWELFKSRLETVTTSYAVNTIEFYRDNESGCDSKQKSDDLRVLIDRCGVNNLFLYKLEESILEKPPGLIL